MPRVYPWHVAVEVSVPFLKAEGDCHYLLLLIGRKSYDLDRITVFVVLFTGGPNHEKKRFYFG